MHACCQVVVSLSAAWENKEVRRFTGAVEERAPMQEGRDGLICAQFPDKMESLDASNLLLSLGPSAEAKKRPAAAMKKPAGSAEPLRKKPAMKKPAAYDELEREEKKRAQAQRMSARMQRVQLLKSWNQQSHRRQPLFRQQRSLRTSRTMAGGPFNTGVERALSLVRMGKPPQVSCLSPSPCRTDENG